jgi:outer membrane lipoprotein carrier protein
MKRIATFLIALCTASTWAGGLEPLENFIRTVRSGRTDFTQVVTAPAKQGQVARTKQSSGTFEFSRPGKFRFSYKKPFEQTIVADGQTLWLYDPDLNQATARQQASALGSTPAALIASASDVRALERDFVLVADGVREGLEWVLATPRNREGSLQSVGVGFRGNELAALEILDSFGQKSVLRFTGFQVQSVQDGSSFAFKPPPGVDVIRQ